jgi:alpha-glucuronidase
MKEYNEYKCWMQVSGATLPAPLAQNLAVICTDQEGIFALDELQRGLKRFAPLPAPVSGRMTLLGTLGALNANHALDLPAQKPEGFVIRVSADRLIIAGQDKAGLLYGVYRFLALLAQGALYEGFALAQSPSTPLRMINHWDNADGTIERGYAGRSLFFDHDRFSYDTGRIEDYARLLSSIGINLLSINNVNVRGAARLLITEAYLPELARLAAIFRPFNIRLAISVNFAAPYLIGGLASADPLDPAVASWWAERADLIYQYVPDLAGFVVKADSEHEPGPFQYGRGHAQGANMLAAALQAHGGRLWWRCFVYNCTQDWRDTQTDRARAAFDHFKPLDGQFADNVFLQIKHGPYDFQVAEPVSPLFGALERTKCMMELQITQEYTGHQIDLCFLPWVWTKILHFDTGYGRDARIAQLMGSKISGLAAVGNSGLDRNWTGHTLAQANLYGFGRLAWDVQLSAAEIAAEWAVLTFGVEPAAQIAGMLLDSAPIYQKYTAPFGVCFMVEPSLHYGPNVEGYEFSRWGTYHRADRHAIGIDRTAGGTGYTEQYAPTVAAVFADPARCPEEFLLFFHRLRYDFIMKNGQTLLQNIYDSHFEGYDAVQALINRWSALKGSIAESVYESVKARMEKQLANARQWRDVINTYFYRRSGIADGKGRKVYE